ncbi:helix-turn-helix domain-containing protein [Tessaracoccus sp. MC1756]|uniref:winged helix-turn-helix domain-containing protein n=1 Tax=Tessaracoccus sp. MC1756 TaxID=2760311 RepID=UPI00160245E3|nr:helix-turn-helix domain-containing protein [Tessaracoccus sp. MC1756]MBB1509696.1 helix-turn-helix transcriptional regulator [Tessaracoccus sp. MC1756]
MTGDEHDSTTDPTRIRALAHPIRLALLDYLSGVVSATATQCAEVIGESVASCSFHLRTLAKHGYITRAESGDAKSRPWQVAARRQRQMFSAEEPESLPAVLALGTAVVTQEARRLTAFLEAAPGLPTEAIDRTLVSHTSLWVTHDEHEELMDAVLALFERYRDRNADESLRPEGALRNTVFMASTPELSNFDTDRQGAAQ